MELATGRRPAVVISREDLNRGSYTVVVLFTSSNFEARSKLPNCVPFSAGEFGLDRDCVAQCESITFLKRGDIDEEAGPIGTLSGERLRCLIHAVGHVIEANCEPA